MNKKQATAKADKLFSAHIRSAGRCFARGQGPTECNGNLQCCHVMSRRYRAIRWNEDNAVCMCAAHHYYYTNKPLEWEQLCRDDPWIDWDDLRHCALNCPPMDPYAVIERYTGSQ
jgi:hypothetical protein